MSRVARLTLGILGYVMMGTLTARIATAVVGPADSGGSTTQKNTAARSVLVAVVWPLTLPVYLFIAAGQER